MNIKFKKGFTLVETLVAIAIFAFAITGLISITARGIFDTNFVKNKFTAGYLALEGAELVRNIRDSASINGSPWTDIMAMNNLLGNCTAPGEACFIDAEPSDPNPAVQPCSTIDDCPYLSYRPDNAKFNYEFPDNINNFASIFKRTIFIEPVLGNAEEMKVTSRVEWDQGSETRRVEFVYNMLNWAGQ